MRRVASLAFAVMIVLLVPALLGAQGFGGLGLPLLPSFGGTTCGPAGCGDPGGGAACCPAFYVGYEIPRSRDRRPFHNDIDFSTLAPDGTSGFDTRISEPGGLWLGASKFCHFSDKGGVMVSGWYLFPNDGSSEEIYYPTAVVAAVGNRQWSTNRSWGWIDGAIVLGSPCGINLIGGFRWDVYNVRFRDPRPVTGAALTRGTLADEADMQLNSYIPFVGSQICYGGPCCGLLFRAIGFPWVPGTLKYGETGFQGAGTRLNVEGNYTKGYFLEFFSEYSMSFGNFGCLGIFGRWNYLEVLARTDPKVLGLGITLPDAEGPIRESWTVGGRAAVNFSLPF